MATVESMRTSLVLLVSVAAALASCSAQAVPVPPADNAQLVQGSEIWARTCVSCHGRSGEGGRGDKLNEGQVIAIYPDIQAEIDIVADGKGAMPGFGGKLTDEEIEAVVAYTREVL